MLLRRPRGPEERGHEARGRAAFAGGRAPILRLRRGAYRRIVRRHADSATLSSGAGALGLFCAGAPFVRPALNRRGVAMPLPGGGANKLGNRYEAWWATAELARMLSGDSETVLIEPPGRDKVDLVVTTQSRTESHQVKRANTGGKWRLRELQCMGLLDEMKRTTADDNGRFVFVSGSDVPELSELCKRARQADSLTEFDKHFLAAKTYRQAFGKLLGYWNCDERAAVATLRRIDVRIADEHAIRDIARSRIAALFLDNPDDVLSRLRGIADDSVHRPIACPELIDKLKTCGYRLRKLRNPQTARNAVRAATDDYLEAEKRRLIGGQHIPRSATATLLERLGGSGADSVITGKAGSGKTAFVADIADALRGRDWPVVAFRFDRLPAVRNTNEIGEYIGLEKSPALVLASAADAAKRPGVLIIDQLDSVSAVSGRNIGALDLVHSLIREAREVRARTLLHVILVCRAFDLQNDFRLRSLIRSDESMIDIGEFTPDDVASALNEAGFNSDEFKAPQKRLLQLPQNLRLFLDSGFSPPQIPGFDTTKAILDLYWDEKRISVSGRIASGADHWMGIIEALCDEMTRRQQLSVTKERLDVFPPDYVKQMTSEGVLTYDRQRYAFGHEIFFDYCFARIFVAQSRSILDILELPSEQHLFRRAQIRQILVYMRDADHDRYIQELCALLASDEVRIHIKQLAFALLADVRDPRPQEWDIWLRWITPAFDAIHSGSSNSDALSALAWRMLYRSASWFIFLADRGIAAEWLASDNTHPVDMAVGYIASHHRRHPKRAVALLQPYLDKGGAWPERLRNFCAGANPGASRQTFDLFLQLLDRGLVGNFDDPATEFDSPWSVLRRIGEDRLDWAPEFAERLLRRHFGSASPQSQSPHTLAERLQRHADAGEVLYKSAAAHPAVFVKHILPMVREVSERHAYPSSPPQRDAVWPFRLKSEIFSLDNAIVEGLVLALTDMAKKNDSSIRGIIADLRSSETSVANTRLLSVFSGGAATYAADAVEAFCDEPWRFRCGFRDSPYWTAGQTISAIVPHSSPGDIDRLENAIFDYRNPAETSAEYYGYRKFGSAQYSLLAAIPEEFQSDRVKQRLRELRRKFPKGAYGPPKHSTGYLEVVASPIDNRALSMMSDDQWLAAMAKYSTDDPATPVASDSLRGGALELARALQERTKADLRRFALLALRIPKDANPVYIEHILNAFDNADIADKIKIRVCEKAYADARAHCGRALAAVLGSVKMRLSTCAVSMLTWLALESDDPSIEAWKAAEGSSGPYYGGDIYTTGIHTVRGSAACAIRTLIIHDDSYIDVFKQVLARMVKDNSSAVLSCVAGAVRAVAYYRPRLGLRLFLDMKVTDEGVFATRDMEAFLWGHIRRYFDELKPTIERMIQSSDSEVAQAGARVASVAVLCAQPADDLVERALLGSAHHRRGVATVAGREIANSECRERCETVLSVLFNDIDKEVRQEAASCFQYLAEEPLVEYDQLIRRFLASQAFTECAKHLLDTLEGTKHALPDTVFEILDRFFSKAKGNARYIVIDRYFSALHVTKIVFRIYRQHENDGWTQKCLDTIDRLYLEGTGDVERHMEDFER